MHKDITKCTACGKDHKNIEFFALINPAIIDGKNFYHVGQCPNTYELIFVKSLPKDKASKE